MKICKLCGKLIINFEMEGKIYEMENYHFICFLENLNQHLEARK